MPFHIHTAPGCFWVFHDPGCAALGAEVRCILIEMGVNKGKYVCIHADPREEQEIASILRGEEPTQRADKGDKGRPPKR